MKKKLQILRTALLIVWTVAMLFIFDYWLFDMSAFFKGEWQEAWFGVLGILVFIADIAYTVFGIMIIVDECKKIQ